MDFNNHDEDIGHIIKIINDNNADKDNDIVDNESRDYTSLDIHNNNNNNNNSNSNYNNYDEYDNYKRNNEHDKLNIYDNENDYIKKNEKTDNAINNYNLNNGFNKNSQNTSYFNNQVNNQVNNQSDNQSDNQIDTNNNNNNNQKPVDVRIIVDGPENSEFLSKAIKNIDLFNDFNIIISSIITTKNVEIAKNAVLGSDIILIATQSDEEGEYLFSNFYNNLKNDFNYVEYLNFPKFRDIEITDIKNVEVEIKNSIIRAGLASIFDIANINQVRSELLKLGINYDKLKDENEKISLENEMLIKEAKHLREENFELINDIKDLNENIDEVKLDFTDFKSRYSNIHTKNLLEVFEIGDLWVETFNDLLDDAEIQKIVIATNKFKPENIIVGQGYIGAFSKEDAIDWLKVVKTALIFVESNSDDLQKEIIKYYKRTNDNELYNRNSIYKKDNSQNNDNISFNLGADDLNPENNYKNYKNSSDENSSDDENKYLNRNKNKSNNKNKDNDKNQSNNSYDDEIDDEDYDITDQFRNFWD